MAGLPPSQHTENGFLLSTAYLTATDVARGANLIRPSQVVSYLLRDFVEDDLGIYHVKMRRALNGVPIFGPEPVVEIKNGSVVAVFGDRDIDLSGVNTVPALSAGQAISVSKFGFAPMIGYKDPKDAALVVFAGSAKVKPTLCWRFSVISNNTPGVDNYNNRIGGSFDFGFVHYNCGIQNKVYYLLSQGGTHYGVTVSAIGRDKAERIFYRTLISKLSRYSDFIAARRGSISAAEDIYGVGSYEANQVRAAWNSVQVSQ